MDHDTNDGPDGSAFRTAPPTGDPACGPDPALRVDPELGDDPAAPAPCLSVFDRWRCAEPDGHDGPHRTTDGGSTTSWSDSATGRGLRGWTARSTRGPRVGATGDE